MSSRVVEYIIRAKDATKAAVKAAKDRVIQLGETARREKVEIHAEDKATPVVRETAKRIKQEAESAAKAVSAAARQAADGAGDGAGQLEQRVREASSKIVGNFLGLPGPVGNVFSFIADTGSKAFLGIGAAVSILYKTASAIADAMAEKWKRITQTIADNWSAATARMGEMIGRVGKDLDRQNDAIARAQEMRRAMGEVDASGEAAGRALAREREMRDLLAGGGTSAEADAMRKRWEEQDKYLALKEQELDIDRQLEDEDERILQRARDLETLKEAEKRAMDELAAVNADVARIAERANEAEASNWPARRQRITDEVKMLGAAADARSKAALQALMSVGDRREAVENADEEGRALADRLVKQKEILATQRESLRVSIANADAYDEARAAEEEAARAEEEARREAERAAQEEQRRQEQLAREQERILADLERERERMAEKAYRREVKLAQDAAQESARAESDARSRLDAANQRVAQAWTWYRDKDSMQAHIDDVLAQREAEKQWEKDFKRLQSRFRGSTWKDVDIGKLSAEEEAVRQVALAKEEQAAAQKALDAIEENTRNLAEKLDELLTMKEA